MSGKGTPEVQVPDDAWDLKVAIVAAEWHERVTEALLAAAVAYCREAGIEPVVVRVPGSFELPVAAQRAARTADAVIALGVVVRGGTPHFEYVCTAVTDGLVRVALDESTAIGFGVLTCDTVQQALDRAGLPTSSENKGREAAAAGVRTALAMRELSAG